MLLALLAAAAVHAPAHATLRSCVKATDIDARAAVFEGSMRTWRHSERLQMRFRLQAKTPEDPVWRGVDADGFGQWQTADRGVRRYVYDKRVEGLPAPASYRAVVRFRWLDARGRVVGGARRVSRPCHEPDPRPDLTVRQLLVYRTGPGTARYVAVVANTGRTAADAFDVRFDAGATTLGDMGVGALPPGAIVRVPFAGPACTPGESLAATVDAAGLVDERDESNNVLASACAYTQRQP